MNYQEQKRVKTVPQKFRQPTNTDAELNAENAKRKKKANIATKAAKEKAKTQNMAHLVNAIKNVASSSEEIDCDGASTVHENMQHEYLQDLPIESSAVTDNFQIELSSAGTSNFATIVRQALETLEGNDDLNHIEFAEGQVYQLDDHFHLESNHTNISTHMDDNIQQSLVQNMHSVSTLDNSIHQQQFSHPTTETQTATPFTPHMSSTSATSYTTSIIEAPTPTVIKTQTHKHIGDNMHSTLTLDNNTHQLQYLYPSTETPTTMTFTARSTVEAPTSTFIETRTPSTLPTSITPFPPTQLNCHMGKWTNFEVTL